MMCVLTLWFLTCACAHPFRHNHHHHQQFNAADGGSSNVSKYNVWGSGWYIKHWLGLLEAFWGVGFPSYLIFDSWWLLPGFRPQISLNSPAGMRKDPSMELLRIGQLKALSSPDPQRGPFVISNHNSAVLTIGEDWGWTKLANMCSRFLLTTQSRFVQIGSTSEVASYANSKSGPQPRQ